MQETGGRVVPSRTEDLAGPLYPKPLEGFEIIFVDPLGRGSFEVGVQLEFPRGSYGETLFVTPTGDRSVIAGGRAGLTGP